MASEENRSAVAVRGEEDINAVDGDSRPDALNEQKEIPVDEVDAHNDAPYVVVVADSCSSVEGKDNFVALGL